MDTEERADQIATVPLIVDLDGTLTKINSLHEAIVQLSAHKPLDALHACLKLRRGRAAFKAAVADHILPDPDTMPISEVVLETIKKAKRDGQLVYLATAADRRVADAISKAMGLFDGVFASETGLNLKGKAKSDRLVETFGAKGFDYIGNSTVDIPVWRFARTALVSGVTAQTFKQILREVPDAILIDKRDPALSSYLHALRPHQWLKNVLVALPAIAGHAFNPASIFTLLIAFLSFSLAASSVYLVNDMIDLPYDRAHREKRHRPLASGAVPLRHGAVLLSIVFTLSVCGTLMLPPAFMIVLLAYFSLSMSYSLYLKRKLMIDVVALAALYGIRVLAGGAATGILLSHWLVGFCFFIFLSLALVKRASEMIEMPQTSVGNVKGRGYRVEDAQTITALTAASGFVAVLVLALYINSTEVIALYRRPDILWGICILLVYWLGRAYFLTGRGEMNQDPVIFAATDRVSILTGLIMIIIFLVAL